MLASGCNMSFRHIAVICSVLICVSAKSFTLVIDTTYSMEDELYNIQSQIPNLISSIEKITSIDNYVLVPFNDPDVGPVQTFTKADWFVQSVRSLSASGGHDIPENSLTGLEKALRESKPDSDIFLFTDACAKDEAKLIDIEKLCRMTRSKVIVFMSGTCPYASGHNVGNIETYYQITKVCFGNVFQMDRNNYGHAFTFMKEVVKDGYSDVRPFESVSGSRQIPFEVDKLTRGLIVVVSGGSPILQLSDEGGQSPRTETLIESRHSLVVRIVGPHRGQYKADVRCRGMTSVTIYSRKEFPFNIGFSPLHPRHIEETTPTPLPGRESFIYVLVPKNYEYKLGTMTIHFLNKDSQKTLDLVESSVNARVYISQAYFEPGSIFRMTVKGMDSVSSEPVQIISKTIQPQREGTNVPWSAAVIETIIPETSITDYKKNTTVACKVTGCPRPTIWWEDEDGQNMPAEDSLFQYPQTYISYVKVPNLVENRTITCNARTASGNDTRSTQLYVYRPYVFQMIRKPEDTTFEYEAEGKIYCEVNAYPEAEIRWYHNDNDIVFTTNEAGDDFNHSEMEYFQEDNALFIKNMTSKHVGKYTCDVRNDANAVAFEAQVGISGLESPVLEMSETQLTSRLGESVKIECRVAKGTPKPTVTWQYKPVDGYAFTDLSEDIEEEEEHITISEVTSKHKGAYKCEAVNEQGKDTKAVDLRVIYAPKIENASTTIIKEVHRDDSVILECSVDAEPKASVKWERSDGAYFPDEKHVVDGDSLKFDAGSNDSGSYRCIAENEAGTADKNIILKVLVPPYITKVNKNLTVRAGTPLKLTCQVQEADPPPDITWRFLGSDSKLTELSTVKSKFLSEHMIPRVTRADAGTYQCFAENKANWDVIDINVHVK